METLLPVVVKIRRSAYGISTRITVLPFCKVILIGSVLSPLVLIDVPLLVVVKIIPFAYGISTSIAVSPFCKAILVGSVLSLSPLMEKSLPVAVMIKPLDYGISEATAPVTAAPSYTVIPIGYGRLPSVQMDIHLLVVVMMGQSNSGTFR